MTMFNDMDVPDFKYKTNCIQKTPVLDTINDLLSEEGEQRLLINLYRQAHVGRKKLRTYRLFKKSFTSEIYLKKPRPFKVRQSFALIRRGTALLRIETGRFENTNVEERICPICNIDVIEDEKHFLMSCNAQQQERYKLLMVAEQTIEGFSRLSLEDKFVILMSNPQLFSVTARDCHNIIRNRTAILYKLYNITYFNILIVNNFCPSDENVCLNLEECLIYIYK